MKKNNGILFDSRWDVDKYKGNYDSEYWGLCRLFMVTHKTKYPEQKLVLLTEAFYQMGVYGSSYDPKTTRMVSALTIEVLERFLELHPGALSHPFDKSIVVNPEVLEITDDSPSLDSKQSKSASIWDVSVDKNIVANVLLQSQLQTLFKGFVIIYDVRQVSTMNDNKTAILEDSFKRSKFGPVNWDKEDTNNNICPIKVSLKWKGTVLAEAVGSDEKTIHTRLAQAILSKIANFSHGIEAKWSYYRDGKMPDIFDHPNPRRNEIYKVVPRSQFRAMAEITSYIDTFANSDSYAETIFGLDFSTSEKKQIMDYVKKSWGTKLTYRTVHKLGVKNKGESHVCVYHIHTGEELRRWLDKFGGENERYRIVPPGKQRRAGDCDSNVREVLKSDSVDMTVDENSTNQTTKSKSPPRREKDRNYKEDDKKKSYKDKKEDSNKRKDEKDLKESHKKESGEYSSEDLEKLLSGFVLFYDAKKNSEIDKDDWFSALCESFKLSKFGELEVTNESSRPLRTKCTMKWKGKTLASAEGLSETQAKTAATLQLMSKLEPFTYIIQAKEEYFCGGSVPPFLENPDPSKAGDFRVVRRKDLPSYYSIFQTVDEFAKKHQFGEVIFGSDFTWELKNEIVVYLKAKGLDHRYFTMNNQKPWSHMAIYHTVKPEKLKDHLLSCGGENAKYKLIPPSKAEPISSKTTDQAVFKEPTKPPPKKSVNVKAAEMHKQKEEEGKDEGNKIQIKLKSFKKDKDMVEYPEDTGGDFPGLIIWIGVRKNSVVQKNLFCVLLESFKMSKYGELNVEESEENVWGRKEPFKKCVIKANRKVLAVGLGESKTEAKNSASLQVLRQIRKHNYTIQAKESYFKEGKATPYNFNPDPLKEKIYRVVKRNKLKDRSSFLRFIDDFNRKNCSEEVIFGDDFTYDEREYVLDHCRKINLSYRLMKCQSSAKTMHTHIAIFHQRPLPKLKAELMEANGENDMYRLIHPGAKITNENSEEDLWPETLENEKVESKAKPGPTPSPVKSNSLPVNGQVNNIVVPVVEAAPVMDSPLEYVEGQTISLSFGHNSDEIDNFTPAIHLFTRESEGGKKIPIKLTGVNANKSTMEVAYTQEADRNQPPEQVPQQEVYGSQYSQVIQTPSFQELPFGPQPRFAPPPPMMGPFTDLPLAFGPQPAPIIFTPMPGPQFIAVEPQPVTVTVPNDQADLRDELARKRQAEREVFDNDMTTERKVIMKDDKDMESWSRKVFVSDNVEKAPEKSTTQTVAGSREKSDDLRERLKHRDQKGPEESNVRGNSPPKRRKSPERTHRRSSPGLSRRRISPGRDRRRGSPGQNRRRTPPRFEGRRGSPDDKRRRLSPGADHRRKMSPRRNHENERLRPRERSPDRRSPIPRRVPSPVLRFRELWNNVPLRFSEMVFMYKYVKQDSTTESDPFLLLRATRSLTFNVDFEFIKTQLSIEEWQVEVELVTNGWSDAHPLVGEGYASTEREARRIAALHAVDTIQKSCRVIEPNLSYFAEGGVPEFIIRKAPLKTSVYEIIQNLDPSQPVDRYTVEVMLNMFISSDLEDLFFLATDFSYLERVLIIEMATKMNLWWRLFGPRHPEAPPDDIVNTQHVCVFKQKSALQLVRELLANGGSTHKYTLVDPRESRITRWPQGYTRAN